MVDFWIVWYKVANLHIFMYQFILMHLYFALLQKWCQMSQNSIMCLLKNQKLNEEIRASKSKRDWQLIQKLMAMWFLHMCCFGLWFRIYFPVGNSRPNSYGPAKKKDSSLAGLPLDTPSWATPSWSVGSLFGCMYCIWQPEKPQFENSQHSNRGRSLFSI